MTGMREQVERFYEELWNRRDAGAIPSVLREDVRFRGSLGEEKRGHAGFADYVARVHGALDHYVCTIEDLVVEEPKAFARVTFSGVHVGELMGYAPTGKRVIWTGCALFTFEGGLIAEVWVLGDLKGLEAQLEHNRTD